MVPLVSVPEIRGAQTVGCTLDIPTSRMPEFSTGIPELKHWSSHVSFLKECQASMCFGVSSARPFKAQEPITKLLGTRGPEVQLDQIRPCSMLLELPKPDLSVFLEPTRSDMSRTSSDEGERLEIDEGQKSQKGPICLFLTPKP